MAWLDGFQKITWAHTPGLRYLRPVRAVLFHTTEGSTESGAFSVYGRTQAAPHFTVNPDTFARYQHVDTDLGAYALRNEPGGVETNTTGIIQIEIVGRAAETWAWSTQRLRWLGEELLAPILAAHPTIPWQVYGGPRRMTGAEWDAWPGGLCGHKDAPENDHWDPGDLNLQSILSFARGALAPSGVFPQPQGDDMALSDDDIERIWNARLPLADGASYPARNVLGFIHGELTRGELLQQRLVDALVVALPVGPSGMSTDAVRTACAQAVRDVLGSLG